MHKKLPFKFELSLSNNDKKDMLWGFSFLLLCLLIRNLGGSKKNDPQRLINAAFICTILLAFYMLKKSFDENPSVKLTQDKPIPSLKFIYINVKNNNIAKDFIETQNFKAVLINILNESSYDISIKFKKTTDINLVFKMINNGDNSFRYHSHQYQQGFNK